MTTAATSGVSSKELSSPPQATINKHNTDEIEKATLDAYRYHKEGSLFETMRNSPFWGIMHDGISKFSKEFNGVFLRGINAENEPFDLPYCLSKMKSGIDSFDIGEYYNTVVYI